MTGAEVEISGIISAIVIGIVVGTLDRLALPGRQRIPVPWTIAVGIVAAFARTGIAAGPGVADTKGIDWIERLIQIALVAAGVVALEGFKARSRPGPEMKEVGLRPVGGGPPPSLPAPA